MARAAALCLLGLLLALRVADPLPVEALRLFAFDQFQQLRPRQAPPAPVAIVDIDDASLEEFGQWPWPRSRIAALVDRIAAQGAPAMAFDIVFAEPDQYSPERIAEGLETLDETARAALAALPSNDALLAGAFARTRVVAGQTSVRTASGNREEKAEIRTVPHAFLGPDPTPFLQKFPDIVQNLPRLEEAAAGRGVFTVRPDADGIYRRVPLVMMVQGAVRLGLAPELLRVATGGDAFAVRANEAGIDGVVLARQLVRTAGDGSVWPYLSPSSPDRFVSAGDLLAGRVPPQRLRGHLVLIGTSAIGLEDFRPTPLGVPMAGVEIHAQVLENILGKSLLIRPNYTIAVELLLILGLGLLVIGLVPIMGALWIVPLTLGLLGLYLGGTWYGFTNMRLLIDPTFPVLSTLLTMMLMSSANYLREERQRRQIRKAFGQYVSPDLVSQLADHPDRLTLGGETRELSVLFSDVRGFTTISESFKSDPAGLTALMNTFLTVLSNAILARGGTIDKFMGDAVMAFWNAPLDTPDHPRAACEAALRMLADTEALNAERAAAALEGAPVHRIDVGIGINTGTCVVGNMGSDTRFDYTALGDAVNLASRLESQSKTYGLGIILGARTAAAVAGEMAVIELDRLRVKGKTEPEVIFGLLGDAALLGSDGFRALARANAAMLAAYRAQDWDAAEAALAEVEAAGAAEMTAYAALYRGRIAAFRRAPPGPHWDGVFTATSK
jgi:adenylate cyclase